MSYFRLSLLSLLLSGSALALPLQEYPKQERLNPVEKKQKALLKCLENRNDGFSSSALLAVMSNGVLSTNESALAETTRLCRKRALPEARATDRASEEKVAAFLKARAKPTVIACKSFHFSVKWAALIGISGGVSSFRCVFSDGRVRVYAGPQLYPNFGVGAAIEIGPRTIGLQDWDDGNPVNPGKVVGSYCSDSEWEYFVGFGPFDADDYDHGGVLWSKNPGVGIGLAYFDHLGECGVGLRLFNGKRFWKIPLALLK